MYNKQLYNKWYKKNLMSNFSYALGNGVCSPKTYNLNNKYIINTQKLAQNKNRII